jgi:TRAP-type C4-dicarboxylate transport system permease small subunit
MPPSDSARSLGGWPSRIAALHDRLSAVSFSAAMLSLAVIVISFCYEVVARYFLNAPTVWASPFASYALCASIFLAMPELTRTSSHIALNFMDDFLSPDAAVRLRRIVHVAAAATCGVAAWITAQAAWNDFTFGITTNTYFPIPKWWLSAVIPYAMASSAIYFVRQAARPEAAVRPQGLIS